jgi:hypothetical protein
MQLDVRGHSGFSALSHSRLDIGEGGPIPIVGSSRKPQVGQSWIESLRRLKFKIELPSPGEGGPVPA